MIAFPGAGRVALIVAVAVGCGRAPVSTPAGTGAKEVAQRYYESLVRSDWAGAYELLHPDSRSRYSSEQFARLAQRHLRSQAGGEVPARVWSCEERGDEAIAHVRLGRGAGRGQHRDGATLSRADGNWRVVLPRQFGQTVTP